MGIKPIDLQSMFAKMNEVSKEQSQIKEQAAIQQSQSARIQIAKEMEEDRKVVQSPEEREPEKIKDDQRGTKGGNQQQNKAKNKNPGEDDSQTVLRDPDVGGNIDLSG